MNYRAALTSLALALVLAGCGQPAAQAPTAATAPTEVAPTATNAPTEAAPTEVAPTATNAPTATVAPTEAAPSPAPAGVLPAPLLFIDEASRLVRLDVDGATRTTIAEEQGTIISFARSPDGSTIAYITVDADQRATLIRLAADGSGRTELASGIMRGVTVAANGSVQAGALFETTSADGKALQGGVWDFPADGGGPALLVAATEPRGSNSGIHYQPAAWSPDGSQLLMTLTPNNGPDGPGGDIGSLGWAVYDVGGGQARELLPMGQEPLCVSPAWGRGGDALFCANGGAVFPPTPALWQLSLADGARQTLIAGSAEPYALVLAPADLADGLYVMAGESAPEAQRLMPERVGPDGAVTPLLPEPIEAGYDGGLWARDGSGIVVGRPAAGGNRVLIWQPLGPGAPVELVGGNIGQIEWASQ